MAKINEHIEFTVTNKISLFSLENRIDYHLERIMKHKRLINFKNSIKFLKQNERILECLIEIISSTDKIISRRQNQLKNGHKICQLLQSILHNTNYDEYSKQKFIIEIFQMIKDICTELGQLIWALNSNIGHIRYVCKVYQIPEYHYRSNNNKIEQATNADVSFEIIPIKSQILQMNRFCCDTINDCVELRENIHRLVMEIFS